MVRHFVCLSDICPWERENSSLGKNVFLMKWNIPRNKRLIARIPHVEEAIIVGLLMPCPTRKPISVLNKFVCWSRCCERRGRTRCQRLILICQPTAAPGTRS